MFHRPPSSFRTTPSAALVVLAMLALPVGAAFAQTTSNEAASSTAPSATSAPSSTPAPAVAAPAAPAAVTEAASRIGTVKRVTGDVWVGEGATRRKLGSGDGLSLKDKISSGPTGSASLMMRDGTVLSLGPSSAMDLAGFEFDSTTQKGSFLANLLKGSVRVVTGLIGKANPDRFKVSTPTSVVGVRGTDFIVETEAQ